MYCKAYLVHLELLIQFLNLGLHKFHLSFVFINVFRISFFFQILRISSTTTTSCLVEKDYGFYPDVVIPPPTVLFPMFPATTQTDTFSEHMHAHTRWGFMTATSTVTASIIHFHTHEIAAVKSTNISHGYTIYRCQPLLCMHQTTVTHTRPSDQQPTLSLIYR